MFSNESLKKVSLLIKAKIDFYETKKRRRNKDLYFGRQ